MAANFLSCTLQDEIHTYTYNWPSFKEIQTFDLGYNSRSKQIWKITQIVGFKKATLINTFLITLSTEYVTLIFIVKL